MEQQLRRACERTKSKQKQNQALHWPRVILLDLAHKQCNGIITGLLHCLTSESKRRFLVNDILFGSAWCLVLEQIQFSLIEKDKDWTSRTLAKPPPTTSNNISFFLYPPTPSKWTHMCITTKFTLQKLIYSNKKFVWL